MRKPSVRRSSQVLGRLLASGVLLSNQTFWLVPNAQAQASGQVCASPGKDGNPGRVSGSINTYYPGVGTAAAGSTSIPVGSPTAGPQVQAGDLLLIVQMQGATFNSSNTDAYGDGIGGDVQPNPPTEPGRNGPNNPPTPPQPPNTGGSGFTGTPIAGNYEYVVATGPVAGGTIPIQGGESGGGLINSYISAPASANQGQQTYQVIRVPQYSTASLGTLTATPWNGATGGIVAFDVAGNLDLASGSVDVSSRGFRGGGGRRLLGAFGSSASNNDFVTPSTLPTNGSKAEGIAGTPRFIFNPFTTTVIDNSVEGYPNGSYGRGAPGNAGGGSTDGDPAGALLAPNGNDENSGGGGGGNGGVGGIGGRSYNFFFESSGNLGFATGGFGGSPYPASTNRLVMGGGGGAGTNNDGTGTPGNGVASSGGAGGGMVFVRTASVSGSGTVNANGGNGLNVVNDSPGGGGAGGSVLFVALSNNLAGLTINANGGNGGNALFDRPHGPGGGGGGGAVFASPGATSVSRQGGQNGITRPADPIALEARAGDGIFSPITLGVVPGANSGAECSVQTGLRLVKRITNANRAGATISGPNFNAFVDGPGSDDNAPGWSQFVPQGNPIGVIDIDNSTPLQSGDEVDYTVYFLSDGTTSALNVNLCDPIPVGTSFVNDSGRIQRNNGSVSPSGTFYSPLSPLPTGNSCPDQSNQNGAIIFNLGEVSNASGNNFGFVRFRVRIN